MPIPMRFRFAFPASAAVALALVAGVAGVPGVGTAAEKVVDHWKDPAWKTPLSNMYVVAVRPSAERRVWWEDGFVTGLARYHVRATASYKKYRDAPPDTQQVIAEVRANGYDGVLITSRLPDNTTQTTTPTTEMVSERRSFTSIYPVVQTEVQDSRTVENTVRSILVEVWASGGGGRLVWIGTLRTNKDVNYDKVRKMASVELVDRLSKDGVLPPLPPKP
jgi:hypothetical protein